MAIKTIIVSGHPQIEEAQANAAITPGELIEWVPNASFRRLRAHATSAGAAAPMFALENELIGDEIGTAYASGETVRFATFPKGSVVLARIAANITLETGDWLQSDGNGELTNSTSNNESVRVGQADESLTSTGSIQRKKVKIV